MREMEKISMNFLRIFFLETGLMIYSWKTAQVSCDKINDLYGHCTPVSKILKLMQRYHINGGNPALMVLFV